MRVLAVALLAGCSSLPPPGTCDAAAVTITVEPVALGGLAAYDDLRFAPALGKVVAAPEGTGAIYLIDPDSLAVEMLAVPRGVGSADASATTVYAADRDGNQIVALAGGIVHHGAVPGAPDYVRVAPTTGEVWVTIPARDRLEIFDPRGLAPIGSVIVPGPPEGLTFDTAGRAYVNTLGSIIAIDVARRAIVGEWGRGCAIPHGFPQVDEALGLAVGGCAGGGGAGVVGFEGELRAGYQAGGGAAVLAYDHARHHLYLRGDPGTTLAVLAVCSDGELGELARVAIPGHGHASSADDRGHVWLADATTGGVLRVTEREP